MNDQMKRARTRLKKLTSQPDKWQQVPAPRSERQGEHATLRLFGVRWYKWTGKEPPPYPA